MKRDSLQYGVMQRKLPQRELPQQIYEIRDLILQSVEAEKIYLFGSYVYGTPNEESDYDFYVVVPDDTKENIRRQFDLIYDTVYSVHCSSVVVHPKSLFEDYKPLPTLTRKIVREGVLLYDRERHSEPMVQESEV